MLTAVAEPGGAYHMYSIIPPVARDCIISLISHKLLVAQLYQHMLDGYFFC